VIRALWHRLAGWFVADVPPEQAACLGCNVVDCPPDRWRTCETRLAEASAVGPGGLRVRTGKLKVGR